MKPSEILQEVVNLIGDPARHTTEVYARDDMGQKCGPLELTAVCWCLQGAFIKINNGQHPAASSFAIARAILQSRVGSLIHFNDRAPHDVLLKAIGQAVIEAKEEEAVHV